MTEYLNDFRVRFFLPGVLFESISLRIFLVNCLLCKVFTYPVCFETCVHCFVQRVIERICMSSRNTCGLDRQAHLIQGWAVEKIFTGAASWWAIDPFHFFDNLNFLKRGVNFLLLLKICFKNSVLGAKKTLFLAIFSNCARKWGLGVPPSVKILWLGFWSLPWAFGDKYKTG